MKKQMKPEDIYKGYLILVNEENPCRMEEKARFLRFAEEGEGLLEQRTFSVLHSLLQEIGGIDKIAVVSGYRSRQEQERIYRESLQENGEEFTRKFVALPGHSEHHTGMAVDLAIRSAEIDFLCPDFPADGIAGEFRRAAGRYGFIQRYQAGKEKITGIAEEPWHFRYVGYPHSIIMEERNLSLEEYIEFIKNFPWGGLGLTFFHQGQRLEIAYLPWEQAKREAIELPEDRDYEISGNNTDGFILTIWEKEKR